MVNRKKCHFFARRIEFLGLTISDNGIEPDSKRVAAIHDWPRPTTKTATLSFLGLVKYYRRFVKSFSTLAAPLFDFAEGKTTWTPLHETNFNLLKTHLTSAPVLTIPNPGARPRYRLTTDASETAIGAVLEVVSPTGEVQGVVAFDSSKLHADELNYPIREKEFLAIIRALRRWRCYFHGSHVAIRTDHLSLEYVTSQKYTRGRLADWWDELAEYNFSIEYVKGAFNPVADALSRVDTATTTAPTATRDAHFSKPTPGLILTREECEQKALD